MSTILIVSPRRKAGLPANKIPKTTSQLLPESSHLASYKIINVRRETVISSVELRFRKFHGIVDAKPRYLLSAEVKEHRNLKIEITECNHKVTIMASNKKNSKRTSSGPNHRSTLSMSKTEIHINVYDLLPVCLSPILRSYLQMNKN